MTVFVILHYLILENTISEVNHVLFDLSGEKKIIIVDNGSPNGSGKILKEKYRNNSLVEVIVNSVNLGFAEGMNIGYKRAKKYDPEFIVLLNNDIEFEQSNFISLVKKSYKEESFAVLGPSVFVPESHQYQNPKKYTQYNVSEVQKIHDKNLKIWNLPKPIFRLRAALKKFKTLKKIIIKRNKQNKVEEKSVITNVVLHGSILVFSKEFIRAFDFPFSVRTFFYFETEILDRVIREKKLTSKYDPSIKVLHHKSSSTRESFSSAAQQLRFQVKNMIKSTEIFLEMFGNEEKNGH